MRAGDTFNTVAPGTSIGAPRRPLRPETRPFSIRLTEDERRRLLGDARGAPLGAYIKMKLLDGPPIHIRRSGLAIEDRQALAKVLALLGSSRLAGNLNQLAHLGHIGALPVSEDIGAELRDAVDEIRAMRRCLFQALGLSTL